MKATGIVRRIDDLGRVVIPKEIRRTMRICEAPFSYNIDTVQQILSGDYGDFKAVTLIHKEKAPKSGAFS